jgi:hypothetical protein
MNENFALHYRIFTRASLSQQGLAQRILEIFTAHPDLVPDHYGPNEPARTSFDPKDLTTPAELLSDKSLSLTLKRSKPRWQAYLNWQRNRHRPWFWTLSFGDAWTKGGKPHETAVFAAKLCSGANAVFAAGALFGDWFDKHDVLDSKTRELRRRTGAGFEVGAGLPGIYWFNFFGPQILAQFGRDWLARSDRLILLQEDDHGMAFLTYDQPDAETSEWRRQQETSLLETLGGEYFFNLQNAARSRPLRRTPIADATDAKSLRG